jgi:exopolyphosphatase / guanosine-5'-triphosphate,3'-diphosphate pyrophosphatase
MEKGSFNIPSSRKITKKQNTPLAKIAAIDIGSNTLRLLIAEKIEQQFQPLFRDREIVRLGRNFYPSRMIPSQSLEKAIKVLKRFKLRSDQEGVGALIAVGTGVLREAENLSVLLDKVTRETGITIRIIPGQEEARLMAQGVLSQFPPAPGKTVIFDIGGGSTEFVFIKDNHQENRISLPLGTVRMTEKYLLNDPPNPGESDALRKYCRNILRKNAPKNDRVNTLIGTAGTVTTLAAIAKNLIDYDPDLISGTALTKDYLSELSKKILAAPLKQRSKWAGLEPKRADIIPAGILLVLEILDHFSQKAILVSDAGLLEGLIL